MPEPKYLQAERAILQLCRERGDGAQLPTESSLEDMLGVSRITIRRAVDRLVSSGFVERIQGKGSFVRVRPPRPEEILNPLGFHAQMTQRGHRVESDIIDLGRVAASVDIARALGVMPDTKVTRITRRRSVDGSVHHLTRSWWSDDRFPTEDADAYRTRSLYELLRRRGAQLDREDATVYVCRAVADDAALLGIPPNSARLASDSVVYSPDNEPLVFSRTLRRWETSTLSFSVSTHHTLAPTQTLLGGKQ